MKALVDLNVIMDYLTDRAPFADDAEAICMNSVLLRNVFLMKIAARPPRFSFVMEYFMNTSATSK